jgi:L,D-transpeptidase YcbB
MGTGGCLELYMFGWRRTIIAAVCAACASLPAAGLETGALSPPPLAPDSVEARLESLIGAPLPVAADKSAARKAEAEKQDMAGAAAYYASRRYAPIWMTETGLNASGSLARAEIARADAWGLKSSDFVLPEVQSKQPLSRDALAQAELQMTRAVLKYGRFARGGRIADPSTELSVDIDRKAQTLPPQTLLEQIATAQAPDAYLVGLHPQHPQFQKLRVALVKTRSEEARFATLKIPAGPTLAPGQSHANVAALRKRLGIPAPAAATVAAGAANGVPEEFYDSLLAAAVKSFQSQSGLKRADGIVGEKTRVALNGDTGSTAAALIANMEQWRWMPPTLGATHVMVNIPQFQMELVRGDTVIHSERIIAGKPDTPTPVFSELMQTVVFQPKWGVPDSIKINELLPRLQSGRGLRSGLKMALGSREIDPRSIDWSRADITRYQVYQPSGDDNALGVVKFLFPNKHSVYLHDTPTKNLFNSETRAFSHGCVRVRNPVRLAELLLGTDKGLSSSTVRDLVENGPENNPIKLEAKIPVHLTYFTALVDDAGKVQRFNDLYGHEARTIQALEGRGDLIAKVNPPIVARRLAASEAAQQERPRRRIAETYGQPTGLGFIQAPRPTYSAPVYTPSRASARQRGNSTNDIIMRQLGGGF